MTSNFKALIIRVFMMGSIIIAASCSGTQTTSDKKDLTPEEFSGLLDSYIDTVKMFNKSWSDTYFKMADSNINLTDSLSHIRKDYDQFISRTLESINNMKNVGKFATELRVTYSEYFKVQKKNIQEHLKKYEELRQDDSAQIKDLLSKIQEESLVSQFAEKEAIININNFKKLYHQENNISPSPETPHAPAAEDSSKKRN